jgi:hypothetical protein
MITKAASGNQNWDSVAHRAARDIGRLKHYRNRRSAHDSSATGRDIAVDVAHTDFDLRARRC